MDLIVETEQNSNSNYIKSKDNFSFKISNNEGVTTQNKYTVASGCETIKVFVDGVIYNNNGKQLIDGFLSHGIDYINHLEGSFIIFLMEQTQFHILTDRVNSRKAFYGFIDSVWHISNNIDALPKHKCQISLDGLACYLANGFMLNDLTLFQEIRSAKRASVHSFKNGEMAIYSYWDYKFKNPSGAISDQLQYQKELELLLIDSVRRRYATASSTALSLSAGYDSRGILGILHKKLNASDISCFSYALAINPEKNSDAALSNKLATERGYPHQILKAYKGNFIDYLKNNAEEGKCLSNICAELDAWHSLAASNQFSDLFVGDESLGWVDVPLDSKEDILDSLTILGASGIRRLEPFISKGLYKEMCRCLNKLVDDIFEKANGIDDLYDKRAFLYLDQKLNHKTMPWRENFSSQVGFVHNPYLDGAILEFMKKLPQQLRKDKLLFKNTIENMVPDVFHINMATSGGSAANWKEELRKHKDLLNSLIQGTDSKLDGFISSKEIVDLINYQSSITQKATFPKRVLDYLKRFADNAKIFLIGPRVVLKGKSEKLDTLLVRLLLMRIYLSASSSDN